MLWRFANGLDSTPVAKYEQREVLAPIKSIGNSWTTPRDLLTDQDVWIVIYLLAESVAARLRETISDAEAWRSTFGIPVCSASNGRHT